jgi:hypothetical protein
MQRPNVTTHKRPPRRPPKSPPDPGLPLKIVGRELFSQEVARGVPVPQAYLHAGYRGGDRERWELRNAPEVAARINWLLADRVNADTKRRHRSEKKDLDTRAALKRELRRIALGDTRDLLQWDRLPVTLPDGTVEIRDVLRPTPSDKLTPDAAAMIKGVTTKSGSIKFEQHDKLKAIELLARLEGLMPEQAATPPPPSNLTVNQVNVGERSALEVAKRVAFMLGALRAAGHDPQSIEDLRDMTPKPTGPSG